MLGRMAALTCQAIKEVLDFAEEAGGESHASSKGNTGEALKAEVPPHVIDTPYGERNAGKIALWELLTKVLFPGIIVAGVLHAFRVF